MPTDLELIESSIVSFEVSDSIGILTINNGKQNTLLQPDFMDLNILKEWLEKQQLIGLVIVGAGRHFSAGADISCLRESSNNPIEFKERLSKGKAILNYIENLPMITVSAISGVCFGGGLEIALSCQFRVCTTNAMFAFPESNIGIMPGLAGTIRLPRIIGKSKALEMIISGRNVNSEEALTIGLVDKVVNNKEHLNFAIEFIKELSYCKTHQQVTNIVQSINNSLYDHYEFAMDKEGDMFVKLARNL